MTSGRLPMRPPSAPVKGETTSGMSVHGSVSTPGADGRVAVHLREVLDDHEEGPEHREVEREAGAVGGREAGPAEERERQHRGGRAALLEHEQRPAAAAPAA